LIESIQAVKKEESMKRQAVNPYLPLWEYIPDGRQVANVFFSACDKWHWVSSEFLQMKGTHALFIRNNGTGGSDLDSFSIE